MDFALSPEMETYRDDIRALVAEVVTPEVTDRQHTTGTFNSYELNRALAERGYLERAVPGLGKGDPVELWLLFHELEKAAAPVDGISMALMIAGVVAHAGNDHQKATVLPDLLTGESLVSLGYSEPDSGSDVAAAATRAVRDGDEWVINGTKMWTTMAHEAKWILLLTRTNLDVPKHKGLTMFILPMDTPGITFDAVHTMGTERTNATFYDDVRIGDEWRIGEVDGGWKVMGVALAFERGVMGGTAVGIPLLRHFHEWAAHEVGDDGRPRDRRPGRARAHGPRRDRQRGRDAAHPEGRVPGRDRRAAGPRGLDVQDLRDRGVPEGGAVVRPRRGAREPAPVPRARRGRRRLDRVRPAPLAGHHHLRRHQRDQPEQRRRAPSRPAQGPLTAVERFDRPESPPCATPVSSSLASSPPAA